MTNKHINEKIAELKWPDTQIISNEAGSVRRIGTSEWYYWASDMTQAWQLFEELPRGSNIFRSVYDLIWVVEIVDNGFVEGGGESENPTLAICDAWLNFKENK